MDLKIVFCLPGNKFSGTFLDCWSNTLNFCLANNIKPKLCRQESPNIYFVRNMCLGGDNRKGKNQKPFDGKVEYDYIMWLDSDIIFNPTQIMELVSHNVDIVSGVYLMSDRHHLATVKEWNKEFFIKNGTFQFLTLKDLEGQSALIDVAYTGLGFMLIKQGVFEKMEYPWFKPEEHIIGNAIDYSSEDASFCRRATELGINIKIDPKVRVGHEKNIII